MPGKLDELDLKIINQIQKDGRMSITKLAKEVESSRLTTTNRLKRLIDDELVTIKGGLNLRKLGFKLASVGLEVKSDETRQKVEKYLMDCPRVLNIFRSPGKANIHLLVWGENDQTINSTIESFRDIQNVDIVHTQYLGTPIHGDVSINLMPMENSETPCGMVCSSCYRYDNEWCLWCPTTTYYKAPYD